MKKHQRQPSQLVSTIRPPSSGPPTVARARTPPRYPLYRPRSRGGIIAAIATWTRAWMPPMPRPWNARAAISCPALCEKPAIGPRIVGTYNYRRIFLAAQVFSLGNGSQARYACRMTAGTAEQAPTPRGDEQARGAERAGVEEHAPGLRERKKAATRHALHEAAVRLAIAHGPDRVTVEAIADEAGVSRRTFSNYFANKEEALLYGDHQRIRAMVEMVRARPAA